MALAVQFLGGVIAIIGAIGLMFGLDALPTERGMAWTDASATAIAGGAITFAIGTAASRLDVLTTTLGQAAPVRAPAEVPLPAAVSVPPEPQRPVVRQEPAVEPLTPVVPPASPVPARPKFEMPSLSIGKVGAVAGAAVATVGAGMAATRANAEQVIADALDTLKNPEPVTDKPTAHEPVVLPVDPPVEILTPVIDDPMPIMDDVVSVVAPPLSPEPEITPEPVATPESPPAPVAKDDPLAAFEQELDRLIPLKSLRAKKGRKDAKAEAAETAAVVADPAPEPHPEPAPEPDVMAAVPDEPVPAMPEVPMPPEDDMPVAPAPEVVGAYESGGAKYTMYSDGSVVAEAEGQTLYFKSLEELREFIDGGVKPA